MFVSDVHNRMLSSEMQLIIGKVYHLRLQHAALHIFKSMVTFLKTLQALGTSIRLVFNSLKLVPYAQNEQCKNQLGIKLATWKSNFA